MKQELMHTLDDIYFLLMSCNWPEKAKWFKEEITKIDELEPSSPDFYIELKSIQKIITGMGSFTDLPLYPKEDSGLTEKEASNLQWELADRLGAEIKYIDGM